MDEITKHCLDVSTPALDQQSSSDLIDPMIMTDII